MEIQRPNGEFKQYIYWNGKWRHVYIVSTHWQMGTFGDPVKIAEFKLTKNAKMTHSAERDKFMDEKPRDKTIDNI